MGVQWPGARFTGAVFTKKERAIQWIARHRLTGVLTEYPLDQGVYDWAIDEGLFPASKMVDGRFIGSFTSASQSTSISRMVFQGGHRNKRLPMADPFEFPCKDKGKEKGEPY